MVDRSVSCAVIDIILSMAKHNLTLHKIFSLDIYGTMNLLSLRCSKSAQGSANFSIPFNTSRLIIAWYESAHFSIMLGAILLFQ